MPSNVDLLGKMINFLVKENQSFELKKLPQTPEEHLNCWRRLINQRTAKPIAPEYLNWEDAFLQNYHAACKPVTLNSCQTTAFSNIVTYHGDITLLAVDAIVNAANHEMLGCFIPHHGCIDNAIHTFAGSRLRLQCNELMMQQGRKEPIGQAKITSAYHLPSRHIIHTVGPRIAQGQKVSAIRADLLKRCYLSCLKLAQENNIHTLAFCGISTGEFGFPQQEAAQIAVNTVQEWLQNNSNVPTIIFNTFTQKDRQYYHELLQ